MSVHKFLLFILMALAIAPAATAQAQDAVQSSPVKQAASDGYILGVNDEIEITIFDMGQNQVFRTRIKEDGTVTVPFLGPVTASNQSARQLAKTVTQSLRSKGIFNNPVVGVEVVQFVSNSVTVIGEVGTPGVYPLDRDQTVAMMVARAGGASANGADYVLLRRAKDSTENRIKLSEMTGENSLATILQAGDILLLPKAPIVYVYGQVNAPGAFAIRDDMTVRQVLVRAGGPTLGGSERNVSIIRGDETLKRVKLETIVAKDDVIYVNEKLF